MVKNTFLSICIMTLLLSCNGQSSKDTYDASLKITADNDLIKAIDSLTLDAVKMLLKQEYAGLGMMQVLSDIDVNLSVSIGDSEPSDSMRFKSHPFILLPSDSILMQAERFATNLFFLQKIVPPLSEVKIPMSYYHIKSEMLQEHWDSEQFSPKIQAKTLYFADQSKLEEPLLLSKSDLGAYIETKVQSSKYIDSIAATFTYSYPLIRKIVLDNANKDVKTPAGIITLENMKDNSVVLSFPKSIKEQIVEVEGVYTDGKVLDDQGTSSKSKPTEATMTYIKDIAIIFKNTINKIDKQQIKSIEELKTELLNTVPEAPENDQIVYTTYRFSGALDHIILYLQTDISKPVTKQLLMHQQLLSEKPTTNNYFLAEDSESGKNGFVNSKGDWVIKPTYEILQQLNAYYFRGVYKEDWNQTFWLNTKNNSLDPVTYELDAFEVYGDYLVNIAKEVNGVEGLINAKTGQMVLPMTYNNLRESNGYFICSSKNGTGLYDKNGKQILPELFSTLDVQDDRIYTTIYRDEFPTSIVDIYDLNGRNLTNGQWQDFYGKLGKDGLLLASKYSKKHGVINQEVDAYINKHGKVVIDVKKYSHAASFSNGMAAVRAKNSDLYGYIDTQGKLVIAMEYSQAYSFQNKYAYVQKDDRAYLIDRKNKVHKELPETLQSGTITEDGNDEAEYYLFNGETYDAVGNLIRKDKE